MQKITMNDGTVFDNSGCGYSEGFLWCYLTGYALQDVAGTFFNADATGHIVYEYPLETIEYDGYTSVKAMMATEKGCSICLCKNTTGGD